MGRRKSAVPADSINDVYKKALDDLNAATETKFGKWTSGLDRKNKEQRFLWKSLVFANIAEQMGNMRFAMAILLSRMEGKPLPDPSGFFPSMVVEGPDGSPMWLNSTDPQDPRSVQDLLSEIASICDRKGNV